MAELADVLSAALEKAENKNFEVIGEKRNATQRAQALSETLEAVARGLNLEGSVDELLDKLPNQVQDIRRAREQLQQQYDEASSKLNDAQGKLNGFERKAKINDLASKAGASPVVFERLFGDQLDQIAAAEDGTVKLGDKPLKEAVEADEALKAFLPALFPTATKPTDKGAGGSGNPPPRLPSAGPGEAGKPANALAAYVASAYSGPTKLAGNSGGD